MAPRPSFLQKNDGIDQVPLHKQRNIRLGRLTGSNPPLAIRRTRSYTQKLAVAVGSDVGSNVEFTDEVIDALVNQNFKGKLELVDEHNKQLKLCIKYFQRAQETQQLEEKKLRNALEFAKKNYIESESNARGLVRTINFRSFEQAETVNLLKEKLTKSALECLEKEEQARMGAEKLQASLSEDLQESLKKVEMEKLSIIDNLSNLRGHNNTLQEQISFFKASHEEAVKQKEASINELKCVQEELLHMRNDREHPSRKSLVELESLVETCSSQKQRIKLLEQELTSVKEQIKLDDLSSSELKTKYEQQCNIMQKLENRIADLECQVTEGERLRKNLHNTIMELKGNIRVFCRVRPLVLGDGIGSESTSVSYPTSLETLGRGVDLMQSGQKYPFTFDQVFTHEASQQDVFEEISLLVQSALDGYKVCIFAYGQTGSGKTYTMMGKSEQKGLIPRSLEQIFQSCQSLETQGWKYQMRTSMLEIYNETIRDLLSPKKPGGEATTNVKAPYAKKYTIKHDAKGNTYVEGLTIVDVGSIEDVSSLLRQAAKSRSVSKTKMNEESSRSHFLFTLHISKINERTNQQVHGVVNLIDLAGSERLSKSEAIGDRLKETQAINKSLSSLGDVIFALAQKKTHIPYRNSKLTHLLQPCLEGDSKSLMIVNISPEPSSADESLSSLRFATRVNTCEIRVAKNHCTNFGSENAGREVESESSLGHQSISEKEYGRELYVDGKRKKRRLDHK